MMTMNLQLFGGRGGSGSRNTQPTWEPGQLIKIEYKQRGESTVYTGTAKLPPRNIFPTFRTYQEADAYANNEYYDDLVNGEPVNIFKAGSKRNNNLRYVVGMEEDKENKRLPKGYRWKAVEL